MVEATEYGYRDEFAFARCPQRHRRFSAQALMRARGVVVLLDELRELAEEASAMRQCEGCRRFFFPKRTDQRFCDSHCGDAARQRAYYAQRKAKATSEGVPKQSPTRRKSRIKSSR